MNRHVVTVGADAHPQIGPYHLVEQIGGGATSTVFTARDQRSDRLVALKMIAADLEDEPETRERFMREASVTAQLQHPHVVSVLDVGEDRGRPYMAMELLSGKPLREHLDQASPLTLVQKLDLMIDLCDGLQAAHDRGIVHRDIKPTNLFVSNDGGLKILDFGLARQNASTLTANGQIVGTPDFMSPEQAEGRKADARSDVFSAAAVSYFILTGRAPFARPDLRQTLMALLSEDPTPIDMPDVPRALTRALWKGLAKAPERRHQRSAELRADLERVRRSLGRSGFWQRVASLVGGIRLW
jgi:serine/threonine-protein kinase